MLGFQHHFNELAGQLEFAFDRLVGVGVDAQRDGLRCVGRPREFLAQQLRRVGLGEQLGFEVQPRGQVEEGVRRTGEAVGTATLYVFGEKCSLNNLDYSQPDPRCHSHRQ